MTIDGCQRWGEGSSEAVDEKHDNIEEAGNGAAKVSEDQLR
jgi:hypothetical protein